MLDDVYLPHCVARLGTDHRAGGGEIQLLTWPPCSPDLSPLDFHLWQEWETALVERKFDSQLGLRTMIVRTMSISIQKPHTEKARTPGFIHRCLACVRARGSLFEHRDLFLLFLVSFDPF